MENGRTKKAVFLAITISVIVFLNSSNFTLAAKTKINDEQVERVKTALSIVKTASDVGGILIDGGNFKTVLNTVIRGSETATDVTYGLLVLSAINEMELMDLVLSGEYKTLQREYFEQILKERTNLVSYWKGVGFDIPKVMSGRITSPISALALNTFEMTDKTILIFTEFEVLKKGRQYDGLWYYFDFRNGGDSHQEAWELVEEQMGWAARSTSLWGTPKIKGNNESQLESRFLTLYEKWSPYATPDGISKQYKEQLASELRDTLLAAAEENTGVAPRYVEEPSLWDKISAQLASIKNALANIVSQVKNPFSAGPIIITEPPVEEQIPLDNSDSPAEEERPDIGSQDAEIPAEARPPQTGERADVGFPPILTPDSKPVVEPIKMMAVELPSSPTTTETEAKSESVPVLEPVPAPAQEPEIPADTGFPQVSAEDGPPQVELCQRGAAGVARQYRVLINEIAWMGTQESANNEWIELKNIFGLPINLNGWQMQDKDQQIKKIFKETDTIPAQGYLVLERSKDYTGALNNTNESLYLFDNNCQLEDEASANPDWPAGDNLSKRTMNRFDIFNWYTAISTPGSENNSPPAVLAHPSAPAPTPVIVSSPAPITQSQATLTVVINEIAWAGTKANSADEWLELYNNTGSSIDLTGWKIKKGGSDWITISTSTISANGYYLLERTDNNTISNIAADQIYTGSLSNSGEVLELRDASNNLIDSVDFSSGWPAGQASPNYISMERINPASAPSASNWANNNRISRNGLDSGSPANLINGTPKAQNSVSKSSTEINGMVFTENITMTKLGSPYIINSSYIEVQPNVTLTIEPGVIVKFNSGTKMLVHGNMSAQGTSQNQITFTSITDSDPENNGTYYIYFDTAGTPSVLEYVNIRYGGFHINDFAGYRAALTFENAAATVSNSVIENNFFVGIYLINSNSTIQNATFRDNKVKYSDWGYGSWSRGLSILTSAPTITSSLFERNYHGIFVDGTCPNLSGAAFGTGVNANTYDITGCAP